MTNETVIQMVKAGLSESVILAKMRSSPTKFDTRTESLIALKQAGTPEKVMQAIINGGAPPASASAASRPPPQARRRPSLRLPRAATAAPSTMSAEASRSS